MTEVHEVQCDRCDKKEEMDKSAFKEIRKPSSWKRISLDYAGVNADLCPDCYRKKKAAIELFMKGQIDADYEDGELQANISAGAKK